MNQHKQSSDLHIGRGWLNRAAEMLDSCEDHVSDAEFARAAAAIGNGFIQLAAVEQWAAGRAEDLAEMAADREANQEHLDVVREANRLILARERQELAAVGLRTEALAALDVVGLAAAGQRAQRAEAEARPHDDEAECTTADVPCRCAIPPTGSQEHLPPCPAFVAAREADRG